ncbi:conserved hypothetical protein [Histoplasma capsulatum var. duboisii H88]|uniref:Uncharacterized protein n=1 Tax=Ajellomyces capsulatus (strain H88) TaxID=544711 RepID=F0UNP9_AJEC8|nr:conserved hypothetical protein [Histoplasma capsulatum var. duboisii H88]
MRDLALLMNSNYDKMIGWNILYLLNTSHGTIEFRCGTASTSVGDISMWIEIAMFFVRAALKLGDLSTLEKIQPTALSRYLCINSVHKRVVQEPDSMLSADRSLPLYYVHDHGAGGD